MTNLTVYNSTNLIVGGGFTTAGGVTAKRIASWGDIVTPVCAMSVTPTTAATATADPGQPANPSFFDTTVRNTSSVGSITYNVTKVPNDGTTAWLTLSSTLRGPSARRDGEHRAAAVQATDTVTATLNTASLAPGLYSVTLNFTNNCGNVPADLYTRTITVTIPRWRITPLEPAVTGSHTAATDASIVAYLNCLNPQTYAYTITNLAPDAMSYSVEETDQAGASLDTTWLALNKTSGGPLAQNQSDTVTVTLAGTGNGPEYLLDQPGDPNYDLVQNAWLKFTVTGFGDVENRQVQMTERWLGGMFGYVRSYFGNVMPIDPTFDPDGLNGPPQLVGGCGTGCDFNLVGAAETGTLCQTTPMLILTTTPRMVLR